MKSKNYTKAIFKFRLRPKEQISSDEEWTDIKEKRPAVKGLTMTEIVQVAVFKQKLQTSIKMKKDAQRRSDTFPQRNSRPSSATMRSSLRKRSAGRGN